MRKHTNLIRKDVPGPSLLSSTTQDSSAKASAPHSTTQPQQAPLPAKPNYDPFKFVTSSLASSRSSTPAPPNLLQTQQATKPSIPSQASTDPFAALSSSRTVSPLPASHSSQKPAPPPSASLFDFASPKSEVPQTQSAANSQQATNGASADDDWNFTSALPDDGELPAYTNLTVSNTSVKIDFRVERPEGTDSAISIGASFSNNTPSLITEYTLQVAVTKVNRIRGEVKLYALLTES